jgi:hypothetical protein
VYGFVTVLIKRTYLQGFKIKKSRLQENGIEPFKNKNPNVYGVNHFNNLFF